MNQEIRLLNIDIDRFSKTVRTIDEEIERIQSLYKISATNNIGEMLLQLIVDKGNIEKCLLDIKLRIEEIQENECNHIDEDGCDMFVEIGYDSHRNYYECKLCGKEIRI
jgi:hypothetical protein